MNIVLNKSKCKKKIRVRIRENKKSITDIIKCNMLIVKTKRKYIHIKLRKLSHDLFCFHDSPIYIYTPYALYQYTCI